MHEFIDECQQIEILAGKIYQHLATNRSYGKEVRDVFQRLSSEEWTHARQLDLVLQTPRNELDAQARLSWAKVRDVRLHAEQILYMVRRGGVGEEGALKIAVTMEEEFIKVHVQNSVGFFNPALAELFARLKADDQEHVDLLNNCLRQWRRQDRARQSLPS